MRVTVSKPNASKMSGVDILGSVDKEENFAGEIIALRKIGYKLQHCTDKLAILTHSKLGTTVEIEI